MGGFPQTPEELVNRINDVIINPILGLLFVAGLIYFFWGGLQFLLNAENPGKRDDGKRHMFWGLIGMFVMASVYGILLLGLNTFGVSTSPDLPLGSWL